MVTLNIHGKEKEVFAGYTPVEPLEFFQILLDAESDYYNSYKVLNQKVLKPEEKKINTSSDIYVVFEPKKEGRKVVAGRYYIVESEQTQFD